MAENDLPPAPHALLVTFPTQGHINPMLNLASRLLGLGFSITLVISDAFSSSLSKLKFGIDLLVYPDPKLRDADVVQFVFSDQSCIRESVERFTQQGGKGEVSCIIFDSGSLSWVPSLAENLKIPCALLYTLSVATVVLFDNLATLASDLAAADAKEVKDGIISRIPGLLPLEPFDIPEMLRPILAAGPASKNNAAELLKVAWKLVNSFQELEQDALQIQSSANLLAIGPLLPTGMLDGDGAAHLELEASNLKQDFSCLEWLDKQTPASVLYISFGSMSTISALQVDEIVQALRMSKQSFLWVFKSDFVADVPGFCLKNLKESIGNQGMIISWAPQLQVLGHKAIGGFLTHGGWNSVMESISMGVPMLGWPLRAEQHLNCKYIVDGWKIGVRISKDGLIEKEEICKLINTLMKEEEGKEMKRRVMELKDMAKRSCMTGGSSSSNLLAFKEALVARSRLCDGPNKVLMTTTNVVG